MILTRNQFFLVLFGLFFAIFFLHKVLWLINSKRTTGVVYFTGHGNLGSVLGISTYQVIRFTEGRDTIEFNSNLDLGIQPGSAVRIRYQRDDPSDAKIDTFKTIWGDSVVYCLLPMLILLALFLQPDIIPKKSRIRLGGKPIIKIINH